MKSFVEPSQDPGKKPDRHALEQVSDVAPDATDYSEDINVARLHAAIEREKVEPVSGDEPVPVFLIAALFIIVLIGGAYFGAYSGGFNSMVYDPGSGGGAGKAKGGAAGAAAPAEAKAEDMVALGQKNFGTICITCHMADGGGQPGVYPPLAGSEYVNGDLEHLIPIVLHGLSGPVHVKGQLFNNAMQAWGPTMNDKKIASILTYVRQAWGNTSGPVTPDNVKTIRAKYKTRATAWTEEEIKAIK